MNATKIFLQSQTHSKLRHFVEQLMGTERIDLNGCSGDECRCERTLWEACEGRRRSNEEGIGVGCWSRSLNGEEGWEWVWECGHDKRCGYVVLWTCEQWIEEGELLKMMLRHAWGRRRVDASLKSHSQSPSTEEENKKVCCLQNKKRSDNTFSGYKKRFVVSKR
jgi:hypothetical protein